MLLFLVHLERKYLVRGKKPAILNWEKDFQVFFELCLDNRVALPKTGIETKGNVKCFENFKTFPLWIWGFGRIGKVVRNWGLFNW